MVLDDQMEPAFCGCPRLATAVVGLLGVAFAGPFSLEPFGSAGRLGGGLIPPACRPLGRSTTAGRDRQRCPADGPTPIPLHARLPTL